MKIAAFYSDSPFAGWVQAEGFVDVLKRMGHEVVGIGVPGANRVTKEQAELINKPIQDCDLIIVSGPEWLRKWIQTFYPGWEKLKAPKVAWYHESFVREDFSLDYKHYESMFDFHFFPDKNDAEKYKGEWLPLGVDTEMFQPMGEMDRDIDVAFIGLMYPKRARFVEELKPHLGNIQIQMRLASQSERGLIPAISVWDWEGLNIRKSMQLLAQTYSRIKVFVTFPSLSSVLVAKVLESMACGCALVAPKQPVELHEYFPYEGAYQCAQQIRLALRSRLWETRSLTIADHRMELRFKQILKKVGACQEFLLREPVASSVITSAAI